MPTLNASQRFSSRVDNYVKYRPDYPTALLSLLEAECGLTRDSNVADIGSGTGKLAELFLRNGNAVVGVEPNREMREAGERLLQTFAHFRSVDASAEDTSLAARSVDLVTAGQAFHWFDYARARREFARILKPGGWVVLVWNDRRIDSTPFLAAYERMLHTYGTDYAEVSVKYADEKVMSEFFDRDGFKSATFDNPQTFDFESLKGRLLSSSYTPEEGHANFRPMLDELERIFRAHSERGAVVFEHDTKVFYGKVGQNRLR